MNAMPSAPGPTQPPVPPPPLGLARWLLIVLVAYLVVFVVSGVGSEVLGVGLEQWTVADESAAIAISVMLLIVLLGAVGLLLGLGIASFVLSIIVIVKARGGLRNAAILALVTVVVSVGFSIELTGDFSDLGALGTGLVTAFVVLGYVFQALVVILGVVATVMLARAYRAAVRDVDARRAISPP